jgi:hypothetical protein
MIKEIRRYLFKKPDEIGLDNYLVLSFCFLASVLGLLGTLINSGLNIGIVSVVSTFIAAIIFFGLYLYSRITCKYLVSKFVLILLCLGVLDIQYFVNYGSKGSILYLFVIVESFIILLFKNPIKISLIIVVFANVIGLYLAEHFHPEMIGDYENNAVRLMDVYSGMIIYLILTVLLLNFATKFYTTQQEKAEMADKLKSAFLANMSHEIRTPMNGILGFAELLKQPNLSGDEQQEFIGIIEKSGARMLGILNNIIDISKIEAGLMTTDIRESDINDQIEYIYSFFKPETDKKGLTLTVIKSLSSKEAIILTDPEKLYAILINLVKNAIKYTDTGSIEFGYMKKTVKGQPELEFFVKDTGIGIPNDRHEAIFERFIQADISDKHAHQGAGLGLSISKAFIEMLGGKIRVESEQGSGSIFYFTLPYLHKESSGTAIKNELPCDVVKRNINNLKTLIVEDDEASLMLMTRALKKFSREVLKVKTGKAAVEACRENPDIDLVLMDIQLPAMNGYEATKEIRKFNKEVIIIAQTAYALLGDRDDSIEAGCNDYITKPINNNKLNEMIREHFKDREFSEA